MRNKHIGTRLLSLVLLLSMLLSMVPGSFAQEAQPISDTEELSATTGEGKANTRATETVNPATIALDTLIPAGYQVELNLVKDPELYKDLTNFSTPGKYVLAAEDTSGTQYVFVPNQTKKTGGATELKIQPSRTNYFNGAWISPDYLLKIKDRISVHCVVPDDSQPHKAYIASNPCSDPLTDPNNNIVVGQPAGLEEVVRYLSINRKNTYDYTLNNIWSEEQADAALFYHEEKTWDGKSNRSFFADLGLIEDDPFLTPCNHNSSTTPNGLRLINITGVRGSTTFWPGRSNWFGVYFATIDAVTTVDVSKLRPAIVNVQNWLAGVYEEEAKGLYKAEDIYNPALFAELEALVITAANFYNNEANGAQETPELVKKIQDMTDALNTLLAKVQDSIPSIDIPVTFYDFRSDGLMFEAANGPAYSYALEQSNVSPSNVPSFPGTKGSTLTGAGNGTKTMGLVESELVDGQIVYTEKTIEYLAWLIARGYRRQFSDNDGYVNRELYRKVGEISEAAGNDTTTEAWAEALGSWDATIQKAGDYNGGYIAYANVETAFDLAYYIATNLWRPVAEDDIMETVEGTDGTKYSLPYNMTVNAYDYLRLVKDFETGAYTVTAYSPLMYLPKNEERSVGLIYNPTLNADQPIPAGDMRFIPMGGSNAKDPNQTAGVWLGFDGLAPEFRDNTDLKDPNDAGQDQEAYHFAMHAHGSFVYRKALNQYFYFLGDDDVYYFINGKLAMDLGGAHAACDNILYLNDMANDLGIVDGGIYSFDMFYIERHTNESNLAFSTNIKIMDTETITTETQFNGAGKEIPAGSKVELDETVTYQYGLQNTRDVPVKNLVFTDAALGVTLSKNICILNGAVDPLIGGNEETDVGKLTLYYCGENKTPADAEAVPDHKKTFAEIKKILTDILNDSTTQNQYSEFGKDDAFYITDLTADQLMELMALGLPVNCGLFIKGFKRNARITDRPFVSELYTICEYEKIEGDVLNSTSRMVTLTGAASVSTLVFAEPEFVPDRMRVVIDYGKPVDLPLSELEQRLFLVAPEAEKVTKTFVGISSMGTHGMTSMEEPKNLGCGTVGEAYLCDSAFGDFLRMDQNTLRYTPGQFLSSIASAYAVYRVDVVSPDPAGMIEGAASVPEADRTSSYYVMMAIEIIPATMMYYEAEDFTDSEIETVNTKDAGSTSTPWESKPDNTSSADTPQDFELLRDTNDAILVDRESIPSNAFFVDFDGDGYAQRYGTQSQYGGVNFDAPSNWATGWFGSKTVSNGVLTLVPNSNESSNNDHYRSFNTNAGLSFSPGSEDFLQMRFRVNNGVATRSNGKGTFSIYLGSGSTASVNETVLKVYFDHSDVDGQWWTLRSKISDMTTRAGDIPYEDLEKITFFNFAFTFITAKEGKALSYDIDYIYIGPQAEAKPVAESLFFGFDNTDADQERYNTDTYKHCSYDDSEEYWKQSSCDMSIGEGCAAITYTGEDTAIWSAFYTDEGLDFRASKEFVVQIRVKTDNAAGTKNNQHRYSLYYTDSEGKCRTSIAIAWVNSQQAMADGWSVYTIKLKDTKPENSNVDPQYMWEMGMISTIGLSMNNVHPIDKSEPMLYVDYIYVGPMEDAPNPVYGYDSSYTDDAQLSNGKSLFVMGQGVKVPNATTNTKYSEAYFSFTGTGFDLISRTGKDQATIRVSVYSDDERTELVRALTVQNKGELELYQIPVVSMQGFDYGTYYVSVGVNEAVTYGVVNGIDLSFLNRGGEFYFDAIRIYDPIDVTGTGLTAQEQIALNAYETDKEAYAHVKEVRNILLSAEDFNALTNATNGAVFIDVNSSIVDPDPEDQDGYIDGETPETDYTTVEVQTYNKIGPKNEVYLAPKQAVAFKLQIDSTQTPASLDIGVKTIDGSSATLAAGIVGKDSNDSGMLSVVSTENPTIESATAQYYELTLDTSKVITEDSLKYVYVVIYNNSEKDTNENTNQVISVTDIKVAYAMEPDAELPKDDQNDTELKPDAPEGDDSGSSNDGGEGTGEAAPTAVSTQSGKRGTTETAPVRFMVDGRTAEAVEIFLNALHETPVDDTPSMVEGIRILHSLNLASDISINYVVPKTDLEGYEDISLNCILAEYEGNEQTGTSTVTLQPVENGSFYYFTLTGLTAVSMNDEIEASLSMTKDGKSYASETDVYSLAQYAYAQLNKVGITDSLKTLCADLLRYGAAAQSFKGYRTDSLADAAMTEAQKAYLSKVEDVTFGSTNVTLNDCENALVKWVGKTLNLDSKVTLRYVLNLSAYTGNLSDLRLRLTYTDIYGKTKTDEVTEFSPYGTQVNIYAFDFDGLLAAELRSEVTAALYAGETQVSDSLVYSADTYGNGKTGELANVCKALFAYSDSAKQFFAAN